MYVSIYALSLSYASIGRFDTILICKKIIALQYLSTFFKIKSFKIYFGDCIYILHIIQIFCILNIAPELPSLLFFCQPKQSTTWLY